MGLEIRDGAEPFTHSGVDLVALFGGNGLPLRHGVPPNHDHDLARFIFGKPGFLAQKPVARFEESRPDPTFNIKKLFNICGIKREMQLFDHHSWRDRSGGGRYGIAHGANSATTEFESKLANYVGHPYVTAVNSCGNAITVALLALGARRGDKVLFNTLTFNAVPSAIMSAECEPVHLDSGKDMALVVDSLQQHAESGARFLLLSHMRGRVSDLDAIYAFCDSHGITVIEDCAHALGVLWNGVHVGARAAAACFSFQSHKILNGGEGGAIATSHPDVAAATVLYSQDRSDSTMRKKMAVLCLPHHPEETMAKHIGRATSIPCHLCTLLRSTNSLLYTNLLHRNTGPSSKKGYWHHRLLRTPAAHRLTDMLLKTRSAREYSFFRHKRPVKLPMLWPFWPPLLPAISMELMCRWMEEEQEICKIL